MAPFQPFQLHADYADRDLGEDQVKFAIILTSSLLSMLLLQSLAFGDQQVTPDDFVCTPTMGENPVAFEANFKSCDPTPQGAVMCQQTVNCALVFETDRNTIAADYKKAGNPDTPFDHIPIGFVTQEIQTLNTPRNTPTKMQFLKTYVTCQGQPGAPGQAAICPGPNQCKGDYRYNPQPASLRPDAMIAPPAPGSWSNLPANGTSTSGSTTVQ
jgi:hypothetical protein